MGDTNCDLKKSKYVPTKKLKSVYIEFQFEQQITNYTRIAPTTNDHGATETNAKGGTETNVQEATDTSAQEGH